VTGLPDPVIHFRMKRLIAPFLLVSMVAMAGPVVVNADPATKPCEGDAGMTFEDWKEWTLVTPNPVLSEGHGSSWVKIHVNELAKSTYLSAGAPYPECAKIVKSHYFDADGMQIDSLTVMVKMPSGYDTEYGDWWYGMYDKSGTMAKKQGRLFTACIACHKQAARTDYLFSEDVLNETHK